MTSNASDFMGDIENYRPLPQGRDIAMAASASKGLLSNEDVRKFESELLRVCSNPNARVKVWLRYLDWFDQSRPSNTKEACSLYKRALTDVLSETALENSADVVTIAYRSALLEKKPRQVFDDMYSKRKCIKVSSFWTRWAQLVEQTGDVKVTRKIFEKALSLPLENKDSVKAAFKNFEERVCCEALQQCASDSQESDALRARFSQLSQDATIVPVDRVSSATVASGLPSDHSVASDSSYGAKKFAITKSIKERKATKSLGLTTEGKVSLNKEKENENPISKFKNESLKRVGTLSVVPVESQFVIPPITNEISTDEIYHEVLDLKANMKQIIKDTVKESLNTFFQSQNFRDTLSEIARDVFENMQKDMGPATPVVPLKDKLNSGGSSFNYSDSTMAAWAGPENSSQNKSSEISPEEMIVKTESADAVENIARLPQEGQEKLEMTPIVRSYNPLAYKQFTPASPAADDTPANVSGFTHLEPIDEQQLGEKLSEALERITDECHEYENSEVKQNIECD